MNQLRVTHTTEGQWSYSDVSEPFMKEQNNATQIGGQTRSKFQAVRLYRITNCARNCHLTHLDFSLHYWKHNWCKIIFSIWPCKVIISWRILLEINTLLRFHFYNLKVYLVEENVITLGTIQAETWKLLQRMEQYCCAYNISHASKYTGLVVHA